MNEGKFSAVKKKMNETISGTFNYCQNTEASTLDLRFKDIND